MESKGELNLEYAFKKILKPIVVLFVQATIICILMSFRLEDQHLSRGHSGDDLANLLQCTVG
jgi:hypothetical protein